MFLRSNGLTAADWQMIAKAGNAHAAQKKLAQGRLNLRVAILIYATSLAFFAVSQTFVWT